MKQLLLLILFSFANVESKKQCHHENRSIKYFKVKTCHRSTLPLTSAISANSVGECMDFTRSKNGLAFNFSPTVAQEYIKAPQMNCQVLSCSEIVNSSTLISDLAFDYYSVYGNWKCTLKFLETIIQAVTNATGEATCVKNIGMFKILHEQQNYTNSIINCQKIGADLADISSEKRTKFLSEIINTSLQNWYKIAYVGLDDTEQEGSFVTVGGIPLSCTSYRAWAPGHPRSTDEHEDCVVLDSERMWRVVNCRRRLPALCELFPENPQEAHMDDFDEVDCAKMKDKVKRKRCEVKQSLHELFKNSSRREKCDIVNFEDN